MIKTFYKGRLPHIQPIGATFFVTFHLDGVIPLPYIRKFKQEYEKQLAQLEKKRSPNFEIEFYNLQKIFFQKYDELLHQQRMGPQYFENPSIRQILAEQIMQFDQEWYDTLAFSIMPNHCHWVTDFAIQSDAIDPLEDITEKNYTQLHKVLKQIKGSVARYANMKLGRTGQFFYHESYDHYVRNNIERFNAIRYTLNNPVKACLVNDWQEWSGNYCSPKIDTGLILSTSS